MPEIFSTLAKRREALEKADIYPVISSEFCAGRTPYEIFCAVAAGGARMVQLREKNWSKKAIFDLAVACREVADRHGMLLIIDDDIDVALAAGADGVHLGQDDLPLAAARKISGELLLGSSTHNPEEARVSDSLADYLNIGPVYPTQTKHVGCGAVGPAMVASIIPELHIPFTVMGGIKARNIQELRAIGVQRIAMVTEITQAKDVEAKVKELRRLW